MIGRDRGEHYLVSINDHESQSRFMARCDTSEKFKTVHHVAVFDGGFFLSRDNGRSYWSRLPAVLATALVNAGRNNDGDVTCVAGSDTGAYYAELSGGTRNQNELWWNTSGLTDANTFESAMQSKSSIRRVEFGENGSWLVLFRGGGSSWSAGLPTQLYNKLKSRNPRLPPASEVTLGPNETWFVRWADAKTEWSLPSHISQMCNNVLADGGEVTRVSLFSNDNYLIRSTVPVRAL